MKLIRTVIVFDQGDLIESDGWSEMYGIYSNVIARTVNPPGTTQFTIRAKTKVTDPSGKRSTQWNRNGVTPIKSQFQELMKNAACKAEKHLSLVGYLSKVQIKEPLRSYPSKQILEGLNSSVGDFDFWYETSAGFKAVVEWETGNISSSHRSLNKLCLTLQAGLVDAAVLIVPSEAFYAHLTDRVGNWRELCPYLAFWQSIGLGVARGLLAVSVVEHDALVHDDSVAYIPMGSDGRSREGAAKLPKKSPGQT